MSAEFIYQETNWFRKTHTHTHTHVVQVTEGTVNMRLSRNLNCKTILSLKITFFYDCYLKYEAEERQ